MSAPSNLWPSYYHPKCLAWSLAYFWLKRANRGGSVFRTSNLRNLVWDMAFYQWVQPEVYAWPVRSLWWQNLTISQRGAASQGNISLTQFVLLLIHVLNSVAAKIIHLLGSHCLTDFPRSVKRVECKIQHTGGLEGLARLTRGLRDHKTINGLDALLQFCSGPPIFFP